MMDDSGRVVGVCVFPAPEHTLCSTWVFNTLLSYLPAVRLLIISHSPRNTVLLPLRIIDVSSIPGNVTLLDNLWADSGRLACPRPHSQRQILLRAPATIFLAHVKVTRGKTRAISTIVFSFDWFACNPCGSLIFCFPCSKALYTKVFVSGRNVS